MTRRPGRTQSGRVAGEAGTAVRRDWIGLPELLTEQGRQQVAILIGHGAGQLGVLATDTPPDLHAAGVPTRVLPRHLGERIPVRDEIDGQLALWP